VVTCTHTEQPVVSGEWIERGATVVTIGSYTPERCEVDDSLLRSVDQHVVDHRESALRHAGTLRRALDLGLLTESDLVEIGDVLLGRVAGRRSPDDVILYTSVGVGVQDAAAAWAALRRARKEGGTAEET
jgi:ornithine cyclodeaminase/alanine dehydrogenase-like protein (mu-crystallin family)